jgi:hypothetical protein
LASAHFTLRAFGVTLSTWSGARSLAAEDSWICLRMFAHAAMGAA